MWSHPYLVALYSVFTDKLKNFHNVEYDSRKDSLVAHNKQEKTTVIPVERIPTAWLKLARISYLTHNNYYNLLSIDITEEKESLEYWTFLHLLKREVSSMLKVWHLKDNLVYACYKGMPLAISLDPDNPLHQHAYLVALEALNNGYMFKEIKGSHFEIRYQRTTEAATYHTCTCTEFEQHRSCAHLMLAKTLIDHRYSIPRQSYV